MSGKVPGWRAGGRRWRWEVAAALALLAAGCTTTAPTPYPCLRIDEVPGLREEMAALRDYEMLWWAPPSARVRAYAKAASIACAYNRELGAPGVHSSEGGSQ